MSSKSHYSRTTIFSFERKIIKQIYTVIRAIYEIFFNWHNAQFEKATLSLSLYLISIDNKTTEDNVIIMIIINIAKHAARTVYGEQVEEKEETNHHLNFSYYNFA